MKRIIEPLLQKSSAHTPQGRFPHPKGLHDLFITPALLAFEQDLGMFDCARSQLFLLHYDVRRVVATLHFSAHRV